MAAAVIRRLKKSVKDTQEIRRRASILSVQTIGAEEETAQANSWRRKNPICKQLPCYNFLLDSSTRRNNEGKRGFPLGFRLWSSSTGTCMNRIFQSGALHTQVEAVSANISREVEEVADIDWDGLGFGLQQTDYMYIMKCRKDGEFYEGELQPFGTVELSPSAGVLNYGQGLFEGLKAYRTADGRTILFRPEENALRMQMGADRLCMPAPSVEQFVNAVKQTVLANKRWIPPYGKGSLYIRILLMGSGPILGLGPAPEVTFLTFVSPVGNYFKEGLKPIHLQVETMHHRSTPGGTGGVKSIGNYAPALRILSSAKARGFSDVLYLDSINKKYVEEASSCNIFMKKDNIISSPSLHGTILPGVTRKTIIALARTRGYEVQERLVSIDELLDADEVFCTGTAVVVSPVGSVSYLERRENYRSGSPGGVSEELHSALTSIQLGLAEDSMGWTVEVN